MKKIVFLALLFTLPTMSSNICIDLFHLLINSGFTYGQRKPCFVRTSQMPHLGGHVTSDWIYKSVMNQLVFGEKKGWKTSMKNFVADWNRASV